MKAPEITIALMVAAAIALGFGLGMGYSVSEDAWRRDCNALGAHVVNGKVWECKERK